MRHGRICVAISLLFYANHAAGEVTAASPAGFVSEHELEIPATPAETFRALTEEVHLWWDPDHSYSGKAENFYLEARAPGRLHASPQTGW